MNDVLKHLNIVCHTVFLYITYIFLCDVVCVCPYYTRTLFCVDINECRNRTICPNDSTCIDMVPGYLCNCTKSGFRWNSTSNDCEGECGVRGRVVLVWSEGGGSAGME